MLFALDTCRFLACDAIEFPRKVQVMNKNVIFASSAEKYLDG